MNNVIEISNPKENYLNDFEIFSELYGKTFAALRKQAIESFDKLGFPTKKNEEWKYFDVTPIINTNFRFTSPSTENKTTANDLKSLPFLKDAIAVVFENGKWNEKLSSIKNLPQGLVIENISNATENEILKNHFSKYTDFTNHEFAALNTAFMLDGTFIYIEPKATIEKPIYIINIVSEQEEPVAAYCRNLIVAGKNSQTKIGFITLSQNETTNGFVNVVNELVASENSNLEFDFIQNDNSNVHQVSNTYVYQKRDSKFSINTVSLGGNMVRNNLNIMLDDENIESHLYGMYVANGNEIIDNHTAVHHAKPHCNSNQLYKGLIDDKATGIFNGKIFVHKDAQKTNAFQSNKNILLSNDANMYSKPQLEIYADDVKCSHGATTGQLDDEALFYLRSRGIGKQAAQSLLNFAFASDVLKNITIESLHDYSVNLLAEKLKK
ncbi:MAG: Fe-S cluster assembly protein SufD [Bacteroidia bacterium]